MWLDKTTMQDVRPPPKAMVLHEVLFAVDRCGPQGVSSAVSFECTPKASRAHCLRQRLKGKSFKHSIVQNRTSLAAESPLCTKIGKVKKHQKQKRGL